MNKLECHKLCKSFEIGDDNINVLNNIDLVIEANDSIAITGKSGAGKSTLLHIIPTVPSGSYFM
ncbi:ATP-binding cassette domain-containing protein [Gammaproteobacteria bacterium]|nr:ATP-binding cassette domain-containing protein [Gammaproteobacteria bacterium]